VLEAAEERARFWATLAAAGQKPAPAETAAPLLVVPLACKAAYLDRYAEPDKGWTDRDEARWPIPYWYIDTGFAALLMLLTAVDQELGGLFFRLAPLGKGGLGADRHPHGSAGARGACREVRGLTSRQGGTAEGGGANPRPCHGQRSLRTHSHRPVPGRE
jgi:hypothetical protein